MLHSQIVGISRTRVTMHSHVHRHINTHTRESCGSPRARRGCTRGGGVHITGARRAVLGRRQTSVRRRDGRARTVRLAARGGAEGRGAAVRKAG